MLSEVVKNPWVRAVALLGIIIAAALLAYMLRPVLVSLALAFLVAYILNPLVNRMQSHGVRRTFSVTIVTVGLAFVLILLPALLVVSVVNQADDLIKAAQEPGDPPVAGLDNLADAALDYLPVQDIVRWLELEEPQAPDGPPASEAPPEEEPSADAPSSAEGVEQEETKEERADREAAEEAERERGARAILADRVGKGIKQAVTSLVRGNLRETTAVAARAGVTAGEVLRSIWNFVVGSLVVLANIGLFAFVAIYLLIDYRSVIDGARALVPPRHRESVFRIVRDIDHQVQGFLRGQLAVSGCLGLMYLVGMFIADVPFALPLALYGTVMSIIPYLGSWLTLVPAVLLTMLQHGLDWHLIALLAAFAAAQFIEGSILSPKILGGRVGLHEVWVILAILVFGNLMGFLGLLIAVPLAAALKVIVLELVHRYRHSKYYVRGAPEDGHELPPPGAPGLEAEKEETCSDDAENSNA